MAACRPIVFALACLALVATSACGVQTTNNRSGGGSEVKTADAAQPQFGLTGNAPVQLFEIVGRQVRYHTDQDRYATALNVIGFVAPTPSEYVYSINFANQTAFVVTATSAQGLCKGMADRWTINERGITAHTSTCHN